MSLTSYFSSWKLQLSSGSFSYDVSRFTLKFTANGKNTAQLDMAVGQNTETSFNQSFALQRQGRPLRLRLRRPDDSSRS
jgi:hypothetical protein